MLPDMKNLIFTVLAALAAFLCSCSGVAEPNGEGNREASYNMGVFLPLSGSNAEAASEVLNGMRIAESHVNSQGGLNGVRLSLKVADTSNPDYEFSSAFNSMASDGVKVFNIGFGNETVFLCRTLAGEENIFVNYLSSYAPVTLDSKNSTRIFISAAQQGDVMASAVDRSDGAEKQLVLMNVDNLVGKSNGDYLGFVLNVGKTKLYKDVYGEGETRFGVFGEQIMRLWAQYVFYVGYGKELSPFLLHLGKSGFKGEVVADCGFYYEPKPEVPSGIKLVRVETLFQRGEIKTPVSLNFRRDYKAAYGREPTWMAAYGYDSVMLLSKAAVEAKFDPKKMRAFFADKTYDAAIGNISFDSSGDSVSELTLAEQK